MFWIKPWKFWRVCFSRSDVIFISTRTRELTLFKKGSKMGSIVQKKTVSRNIKNIKKVYFLTNIKYIWNFRNVFFSVASLLISSRRNTFVSQRLFTQFNCNSHRVEKLTSVPSQRTAIRLSNKIQTTCLPSL